MNMPRTFGVRPFVLIATTLLGAASAAGATATFEVEAYRPSPALVALGVPADYLVGRFYVTTDADILSINQVHVLTPDGPLFQVPPPFGAAAGVPALRSSIGCRYVDHDAGNHTIPGIRSAERWDRHVGRLFERRSAGQVLVRTNNGATKFSFKRQRDPQRSRRADKNTFQF